MRILVVEDEHRIATSIKKGLEMEKFAVDTTFDGISGFDLASSEEYDLLILDIMLPGIDGLEICRRLRSQNIHVPILILTAKSQVQDKVVGLNLGADDYLTKPFSFEELLARVRALIRRPKQTLNTVLKLGDLTLNTQSFKVERSGKEISLTSKEFSLLEYLIRHQDQIIAKQQIINHIWDYDSDILPNTIEVYIRNLRRKVDLPFKGLPSLIHTVRGFGYKIGK